MNPTLKTDEKGLVKTGDYTAVNPLYATPQALAQAAKIQGQPITSSSLANNQNPLTLPETTGATSQTAGASVQGITEGLNQNNVNELTSLANQETQKATQAKTGVDKYKQYIEDSIAKLMGKGQAQVQAEEQAGISQKTQDLTNITNEYNTKALEYRRMEEAVMKEGTLTDVQKNARLREISRVKNTELADIGIRQAVAQNNLKTAQDLVDRKIDLEYGDLKDIIGFQTQFLEMNREDLSKAEQNALNLRITENQRKYDEGLKIGEFAKSVAANGADAATISRVTNAKSMAEAIQAAGQYSGDVLERQIKQNNLYKSQLEIQKLKKDLEPGTGGDAPLYNGLSSTTATAVRGIVSGFKSEPQLTNFATIQDGYNFTQQISNKTTNPADDQALIYALAKTLDPGSVVREGEYATAQKYAQSWIKAYGKGVQQAIAGTGFLSEEARKNIKNVIETKYKSSKVSYDNLYNQYAKQINNLTGRDDGTKFLRDYAINTTRGGVMRSADGTQEVNVSDLTPEQIEEAKQAGWQ